MSSFDDEVLTTQQVARMLGCTRANICLAVKLGRLTPSFKLPGVNGAYLFELQAVMQWRGLPMPLIPMNA